jgi:hypothetical protein
MKNLLLVLVFPLCILLLNACCQSFEGYGRYTLEVECEEVIIDGNTYKLTTHNNSLVIDGHTIARGIYRKTKPWLYIHNIQSNSVDVTFEQGGKKEYPLYTGSSASIFDVYAHPWEMTRSTCANFGEDYWLISHRWSDDGIFFDLQKKMENNQIWNLIKEDIFVPKDGSEVNINEIATKVKITEFDSNQMKAKIQFIAY